MTVNAASLLNYTTNSASASGSSTSSKGALGKEAFLSLMLTELKYQNPLEPLKDSEYIAQLAQFTSLEGIQNINTNLAALQELEKKNASGSRSGYAVSLIGKEIGYQTETGTQYGPVESIVMNLGEPWLLVGEDLVSLDNVVEVLNGSNG